MKTFPLLVAATFVTLALAGCTGSVDESVGDEPARGFSVAVPQDAQRLRAEVSANARGTGTLHVELEREDRSNIAEETLGLTRGDANATLEGDAAGLLAAWILVRAADGDVVVHVRVYAIAADGTEDLLRAETLDMTTGSRAPRAVTPTPLADAATNATNTSS